MLLNKHAEQKTVDGHAAVVRNGYLPERELQTAIGPVTVKLQKYVVKMALQCLFVLH